MRTRVVAAVAAGLLLGGCSGGQNSMSALEHFVTTAAAGYHPPVKPVPKIKPPKLVAFHMRGRVDPFEPFAMRLPARSPNPYHNLPKGPLQHYPLDALTMVGTLAAGPHLWAVVMTPDGSSYRVRVGMLMGRHYGKVVRITPKKLSVVETVAGPTGWVKQPASLDIK